MTERFEVVATRTEVTDPSYFHNGTTFEVVEDEKHGKRCVVINVGLEEGDIETNIVCLDDTKAVFYPSGNERAYVKAFIYAKTLAAAEGVDIVDNEECLVFRPVVQRQHQTVEEGRAFIDYFMFQLAKLIL